MKKTKLLLISSLLSITVTSTAHTEEEAQNWNKVDSSKGHEQKNDFKNDNDNCQKTLFLNYPGSLWNGDDFSRDPILDLLWGFGYRGLIAEEGTFAEKISLELGLAFEVFSTRWEISGSAAKIFTKNDKSSFDISLRTWLFENGLPFPESMYLIGGHLFQGPYEGFFGGIGLGKHIYIEAQLRNSKHRQLAVIPKFGFRF